MTYLPTGKLPESKSTQYMSSAGAQEPQTQGRWSLGSIMKSLMDVAGTAFTAMNSIGGAEQDVKDCSPSIPRKAVVSSTATSEDTSLEVAKVRALGEIRQTFESTLDNAWNGILIQEKLAEVADDLNSLYSGFGDINPAMVNAKFKELVNTTIRIVKSFVIANVPFKLQGELKPTIDTEFSRCVCSLPGYGAVVKALELLQAVSSEKYVQITVPEEFTDLSREWLISIRSHATSLLNTYSEDPAGMLAQRNQEMVDAAVSLKSKFQALSSGELSSELRKGLAQEALQIFGRLSSSFALHQEVLTQLDIPKNFPATQRRDVEDMIEATLDQKLRELPGAQALFDIRELIQSRKTSQPLSQPAAEAAPDLTGPLERVGGQTVPAEINKVENVSGPLSILDEHVATDAIAPVAAASDLEGEPVLDNAEQVAEDEYPTAVKEAINQAIQETLPDMTPGEPQVNQLVAAYVEAANFLERVNQALAISRGKDAVDEFKAQWTDHQNVINTMEVELYDRSFASVMDKLSNTYGLSPDSLKGIVKSNLHNAFNSAFDQHLAHLPHAERMQAARSEFISIVTPPQQVRELPKSAIAGTAPKEGVKLSIIEDFEEASALSAAKGVQRRVDEFRALADAIYDELYAKIPQEKKVEFMQLFVGKQMVFQRQLEEDASADIDTLLGELREVGENGVRVLAPSRKARPPVSRKTTNVLRHTPEMKVNRMMADLMQQVPQLFRPKFVQLVKERWEKQVDEIRKRRTVLPEDVDLVTAFANDLVTKLQVESAEAERITGELQTAQDQRRIDLLQRLQTIAGTLQQ